ncbi:hypothetical protein O9993_16510 [Vibrio lentus]|nr:hypothetical protein [Vibrio lentus]
MQASIITAIDQVVSCGRNQRHDDGLGEFRISGTYCCLHFFIGLTSCG